MAKAGLGWYLDHITDTDLLTPQQEQDLARRIQQDQDPAAREEMISANLRLVVNIAKQFANRGMPLSDLVAEGNIGLMRAVEEFDPDEGVRFSTYAAWWIKQAIKRALINAVQPVRIPDYMAQRVSAWRKASRDLEKELGRSPSTEEIAKKLNISPKKAAMTCQGIIAVNAPTQMSADESQTIDEVLTADKTDSMSLFEDEGNAAVVRKLLEKLPEREQKILTYRFGLDGHKGPQRTFKEIGKLVGLTRERARQLEKEALARLQTLLDEIW